jgi:hypothetical protein
MARMVQSNQYRAESFKFIPAEIDSCAVLLFDDVEELISLVGTLGAAPFKIDDEMRAEMHDWAANEIAFFSWKNSGCVIIRAQNHKRALNALENEPPAGGSAQTVRIEENKNYTLLRARLPNFMRVFLPFAPGIQKAGHVVKQNSEFIFGENPEDLTSLVLQKEELFAKSPGLPAGMRQLLGEKANLLMYERGTSAFFPAGAALAGMAQLDRTRLASLCKIKLSHGQLQAEIYIGQTGE